IPALMPEYCTKHTVRDYLSWISGVFHHADVLLVNSQTTARDLRTVAGLLGHEIGQPEVIRLDGSFSTDRKDPAEADNRLFKTHRLDRKLFVLFVSTFEPRKNHLAAFKAWLYMIERRGGRNVPLLVCVGNRGWMVDAAMALLQSSDKLRRRVRILTGISDAD